jgi:hypothetical protein
MTDPDDDERPWLLDLGTEQRGAEPIMDGAVYDEDRQLTILQEPGVPIIDTGQSAPTKKADREAGEDQKGW